MGPEFAAASQLLGLAGITGGGGTKVSQSSSNTSQSLVSFTSNNNLGGGYQTGSGAPVTAPTTASATASAGGSDGGYASMPSYDYGTGSSEVAATAGTSGGTSNGLYIAFAVAAAAFAVWYIFEQKG